MGINRKPTRYAHSDGHTDVCFSQNGQKLISCGTDGDIRIWSGFDDDDPIQTCVGEWSLCVQQIEKHLYIATDNNNVQVVTFPEGERDGILTRFTAPVNHMAVAKNKNLIALASEDMEVKLLNLNGEKDEKVFGGLKGPPLSVALCPKAEILAVSSGDGYLRVWKIDGQILLAKLECLPKTNSFVNAKLLCRMDFDPSLGHYLAYPNNNSVIVLSTSDWSKKYTFTTEAIEACYSIVQFSPCGNYLAAATNCGDLVVWEVATQILVDAVTNPKSVAICAMVWNPTGNGEIAYCDVQGQLGLVTNCTTDLTERESEDHFANANFDVQFEEDDEDDENVVSLEKIKNEVMGDPVESDAPSPQPSSPRPRTPEIPLQPPFMPSSTPEHLDPRYLCWNEFGVVRSYGTSLSNDADRGKSIEVDFHDSSFHSSMMVPNFHDFTMGCLSRSSLAIANSNQLSVVPLSLGTKEWNLSVEDGEEIVCIANSNELIGFATSNYLIRTCTVYGTQKSVFSVPGPVVSMAAFDSYLLVAYHSASDRKADQCINMILVNLKGFYVSSMDLTSALRPETNLQWIGFTDTGNPAMLDSSGMLSLYPMKSKIWLPVCDTAQLLKSPVDGFFVTVVYESLLTVRGIRCRGSMYPTFTPRPAQMELPLQPPFAEISTEKTLLESNLFMWSNLQVERDEKKFKEAVFKTFALATKNNFDQRAIELLEMLGNPQLVQLAAKYASKLKKSTLAQKLLDISFKSPDSDEEEETTNCQTREAPVVKISKKLVLNSVKSINRSSLNQSKTLNNSEVLDTSSKKIEEIPSTSSVTNTTINVQESLFSDEEPKNPFLKSNKKTASVAYNPLSLTDMKAGVKEKENKNTNKNCEKRKKPDFPNSVEKSKDKVRKLDQFMFSKRK